MAAMSENDLKICDERFEEFRVWREDFGGISNAVLALADSVKIDRAQFRRIEGGLGQLARDERDRLFALSRNEQISSEILVAFVLAWARMRPINQTRLGNDGIRKAAANVESIRTGNLCRKDAYELFKKAPCGKKGSNKNLLPGLGPAFFTKLIYFARPNKDGYIMDQFAAKSVNYLFENKFNFGKSTSVVKMDGKSVSSRNTGGDYDNFCSAIEIVRDRLNEGGEALSGGDVELLLFNWREHSEVAGAPKV